ncbi:MAG: TonB-dependent receptor plug domain-containing protein, partial [Bacteroidales bacterium]|nr:TonB-dependent receptor plug domain-containing protein [Bacteroidales bacterium]
MMYSISKKILSLFILAAVALSASAQQKLTREQILAMTTDELSELPLEDLMEAVETLGVSSVDELFALIMNKNVSSASKQEENTFTSPLSTTVITYDEMRTYGVTTIEEAFRLIPGMIVAEKTNGIYDIQMRGLINIPDNNMLLYTENANTLVLIDGRPVNNLTMGAVNFDMLPIDIEDVDRIEVVRGAASALYGSNAVTGVINILTKKPDSATATVSGNVQLGNDNTYIGNVAIRKAVNSKFAVGLTLSMQHRDRPTDELYVIPASGVYMANTGAPEVRTAFTQEQLMDYILSGALTDMSAGGYVRPSRLEDLKQLYPDNGMYVLYNCLEPESPSTSMFENSSLARQSEGYNVYLTLTPASDIRFDLTAGYQRSYANTT